MRPFTSISRGPSGVNLISVCTTESRMPSAPIARSAMVVRASSSWSPTAAGMKFPVSRKSDASGNRPVTAAWLTVPPDTTLSTGQVTGERRVPGRVIGEQLLDDAHEGAVDDLRVGQQVVGRTHQPDSAAPASPRRLQDDGITEFGPEVGDQPLDAPGGITRNSGPATPAPARAVRWMRLSTTEQATSGV